MERGYYRGRSGDLFIVQKPYWLASKDGTSHGTPFSYDTHVPMIFLGRGIRPGRYDENVRTADIAPTLAALLGVNTPSGSVGRMLPVHRERAITNDPNAPAPSHGTTTSGRDISRSPATPNITFQ